MVRPWTGGIALLLACAGAAAAGDGVTPSPFDGSQNPAFCRWGGTPTHRPKQATRTTSKPGPRANDTAAALRAQEEANFLRRLAVCDKLREMANQTNDESLEKQSYQLQQKAEKVYQERTNAIGSGTETGDDDSPRGGKR